MTSHPRRREDRPTDPSKQWIPTDKYPLDHDADRRRNRSATLPANSYDPRSYPPRDARYNDPRLPSRSHRQDPHYPPQPSTSYHHSSAHPPSTSKAYQHATRTSVQHPSSNHHYPQPSAHHPSHPTYPAATSSRRPHPEVPTSRRPTYDHLSGSEDVPRASARSSRPANSAIQPSISAPPNQAFWNPPQDISSRRYKDTYRDRDRDHDRERVREKERERDRERDRPAVDLESRHRDRTRTERYREREPERTTDPRYQDVARSKHHERRKDSDTEGILYSEHRNASKVSLSGRDGHTSSAREPGSGHRRHRTEDGTASTGRRLQPENTHNPITTMPSTSTAVPQPDVQQTGEPPPAPRVLPVHLPQKAKSQRSQREGRPTTAQGAQSGSDTERVTTKHRMERTPSGLAVQRSNAHTSTSTRDKGNHDPSIGPRDDVKRLEGKHGVHHDTRQPLAQINVDIPLVTPGFNTSALPIDARASSVPQIVSIRAGQGPSDPHDVHFKSSVVSHSNAPQEIIAHPHPTSASIVKPSGNVRPQSSETRAQTDRPPVVVGHSRVEPLAGDPPPGQRVSIHESSRAMPAPISRPSYSRGNTEYGADVASSLYPHSRPPSRSAHRTASNGVPPAVVGPRPLRSVSQGPQTSDPSIRPPSDTYYSVPPSPAHPANGTPVKTGHATGSSSAQPSPKYAQLHGMSPSHPTSAQQVPSVAPSAHPTPTSAPQVFTAPSRPSTRDGTLTDVSNANRSPDQQQTTDNSPGLRQTSGTNTVKASWVVQTPATAKRAKISREDKYLNLDTPQAQLRQVLSEDNDPFLRASSSMMKASQATTPLTSSQRSSFGTKPRDVSFGTPRGASGGGSPRCVKEAPTPEHVPKQNLPQHLVAPPQIAVVGATPVNIASNLPHSGLDPALLAPPFPAPPRSSRTTSQDQQSKPSPPAVRNLLSLPYQPQPAPVAHAPSLFQPYQPPSPPAPEDSGQCSPPPIPVPPPRGLEDSPPQPIEMRTSEIIPTRSENDSHPQNDAHSFPEVQSEMLHLAAQPVALPQLPSTPPVRPTQSWHTGKLDSNILPAATLIASPTLIHGDSRSSKPAFAEPEHPQIVHQEIIKASSVPPPKPLAPTRSRPKFTIEDASEDSSLFSKGILTSAAAIAPSASESRPVQPSHHTTVTNDSTSKSAILDQPGLGSSPQSKSNDIILSRDIEPSVIPTAPPMPAPTPVVAPTITRVLAPAPPTQPTFSPSFQAAPVPRATAHAAPSRTYQRAAEMLQASKLSTSNASTTGTASKSTTAPTQTVHNPVSATTGQHLPNNASTQSTSASRLTNVPTSTVPHPSTSATASMTRIIATTPSLPTGAPVPHTSAASTNTHTQLPSSSDPFKSRPGPQSMPPLDFTSTTVMPTTVIKHTHQEQPTVDTTRPRDTTPSAVRHFPPSTIYPISSRSGTQHTHVTPVQPSTHHRTASSPMITPSSAAQKPPSPRKFSQPISSTTVSTQPFPSRPSTLETESTRAPISGHLSAPVPVRSARPSPDYANDPDMLRTPSSIAPSPMLNPDSSTVAPQSIAVPIRVRQVSTDSKDEKKKGLFGLFRTRTLSSKATDPPPAPPVPRASLDQARGQPDSSVVASTATPMPRGTASKAPPVTSTSTRTGTQSKSRNKVLDPIAIPPSMPQRGREYRDTTPHIFTPFKFLTMHSKRNRTVSAASLDVCDGNTATNTVVGSPDHSTLGQAQPLPAIIPPDIRDPLIAASEWRDREEANRRERRTHRIRRPGVTFDLDEEPPSPAPGTSNKRKKLVRRSSGRAPTPGPPRG